MGWGYYLHPFDSWLWISVRDYRLVQSVRDRVGPDTSFCLDALGKGLVNTRPKIFNTDRGVQFTSRGFVGRLEESSIKGEYGRKKASFRQCLY